MRCAAGMVVAMLAVSPAAARTIMVGPPGATSFADAVRAAADGDTVHLPPGTYYECAVVSQRNLVIEGEGATTVLTDTACEGKALLVARGDGLVVRNLVLARARVPDGNGAGVRLEGQGLTVDHVVFRNDEVAVLAGAGGAVVVRDSTFEGGGRPAPGPTAAVMAGQSALLRLERCTFTGVAGAQVATGASRTEIVGSRIAPGSEAGPAVQAGGGAVSVVDTEIALGAAAPPRGAAIVVTAGAIELRRVHLVNGTGQPATLLLNWTGADAVLSGNGVSPGDTEEGTGGVWRHRAGNAARAAWGGARGAAGSAKRAMSRLFGG